MKPEQFRLFKNEQSSKEHGGSLVTGKRKVRRYLPTKKALHLVMRSSRARGSWSFLHRNNKGLIHLLLLDTAERFQIKIFRFENVGNHLHLIIQSRSRKALQSFLRVLPQRIMFCVTGARKGKPRGRFFDQIAYTRVIEWGREFKILTKYLWKNAMEALQFDRASLGLWQQIAPE